MSIFNEDRSTLNEMANNLDIELTTRGLDQWLSKAFDSGLNIDEILYILSSHSTRILQRYIVQDQLKRVANKEK